MATSKAKPTASARDVALKMLARRAHSSKEIARKLHQKGYIPPEIDAVLADFTERGWLNDTDFAVSRARHRAMNSKWGPQRIRQELKQVGIVEEDIEAALTNLTEAPEESWDHHDFDEAALTLLQRKFGTWPQEYQVEPDVAEARYEWRQEVEKEKSRRISFLMRRGFSMSAALNALQQYLSVPAGA